MAEKKAVLWKAQGIEVEIPQALPQVKPRHWNGKPGFQRKAPEMRLKQEDKNFYAFILHERLSQNFSFGKAILQFAVLQG
ncbi:MAG: hypothetical protein LBD47_02935 [Treponema sp.]|jgi:hypothetical protein|nr:hypothetical protein [Treponema sp.]